MAAVVCENCGTSNPAGRQFCENCDGFLDWSGVPDAGPVAAAPAPAAPVAPQQQARPQQAPPPPHRPGPGHVHAALPPRGPAAPPPGPMAAPPPRPGATAPRRHLRPGRDAPDEHGTAAADVLELRHRERPPPPVLPPLRNVAGHADAGGARPAGPARQAPAASVVGRHERRLQRRSHARHGRLPHPLGRARARTGHRRADARGMAPDPPGHRPRRARHGQRSRGAGDGPGAARRRAPRLPRRVGRRRRARPWVRHPLDVGLVGRSENGVRRRHVGHRQLAAPDPPAAHGRPRDRYRGGAARRRPAARRPVAAADPGAALEQRQVPDRAAREGPRAAAVRRRRRAR